MSENEKVVMRDAFNEGLKAGGIVGAISSGIVYGLHTYNPTFRTRLGISGKVALVTMSALGAFSFQSENKLLHGARNPEHYVHSLPKNTLQRHMTGVKERKLPMHLQAANFIYDYPFRCLALTAIPTVGAILMVQLGNKGLQRSQQLMHTRVYGQMRYTCLIE